MSAAPALVVKPLQHLLELHTACPICESRSIERRWTVDGYTIANCPDCSLVFVQEKLTIEHLTAHYSSGGDPVYCDENRSCRVEPLDDRRVFIDDLMLEAAGSPRRGIAFDSEQIFCAPWNSM